MGLDDRDYVNREHYPSCTCMACCRRRAERAAEHWCNRHNRPKGQTGCQACLLERKDERVPDNGKGKLHWTAIGGEATARESIPRANNRVHSGNRLGRALRGILMKRGSP